MMQGAPHSEGYASQWECHLCGYIEGVPHRPMGEDAA
jgi:hypothetical protein